MSSKTAVSPVREHCSIVGLLSKYWEPGHVKTRLGQVLGMSAAAEVQRQFFCFLIQTLGEEPLAGGWTGPPPQLQVVYSPPHRHQDFQLAVSGTRNWQLVEQLGQDLGERMQHWFTSSLELTSGRESRPRSHVGANQVPRYERAVLIGCDCPLLGIELLQLALDMLKQHDVVLGPAADGGYYLIGLAGPYRAAYDRLFHEVPWSTNDVFSTTLTRVQAAGLSLGLLPEHFDVDQYEDLVRLCEQLKTSANPQQQQLLHAVQHFEPKH